MPTCRQVKAKAIPSQRLGVVAKEVHHDARPLDWRNVLLVALVVVVALLARPHVAHALDQVALHQRLPVAQVRRVPDLAVRLGPVRLGSRAAVPVLPGPARQPVRDGGQRLLVLGAAGVGHDVVGRAVELEDRQRRARRVAGRRLVGVGVESAGRRGERGERGPVVRRAGQRADEAAAVGLAARVDAAVVDAEVGAQVGEQVRGEDFVVRVGGGARDTFPRWFAAGALLRLWLVCFQISENGLRNGWSRLVLGREERFFEI